MHKSERYKFGAITLPTAVLPSLEEVRDAIEVLGNNAPDSPRNETHIHRDSADAVVLGTDHETHPYCHFQYRAVLSGDGAVPPSKTEASRAQPWHVRSRVFYFENGQFAVQPTRGLSDAWLPAFIARITDIEVGEAFRFYDSMDSESNTQRTPEPVPSNESISRVPAGDGSSTFVSTQTVTSDRTTHSAGDPADLLDQATRTGEIEPHQSPHGGAPDSAFAPGTVVATWNETDWPKDVGETRRAKEIHKRILPYLKRHA